MAINALSGLGGNVYITRHEYFVRRVSRIRRIVRQTY